jgi:hypothetical protein
MPVPNTFANATATIPLSQLDANFATTITLGNTAIQLGNTVTTLNDMTLANVNISSGIVTVTNATVTTANVTTANIATAEIANVTVSGTGTFAAGSNTAPSITTSGNTNTGIFFPAADTIAFTEGGVESMRITSAGELLVGGTTSISSHEAISVQRENATPVISTFRNDTSIASADLLGAIQFFGNDTTSNTPTALSYIYATASGTHAAGDNPTDIVFGTTPDGSATVAEAGRITQSGAYVLKGGTTTAAAGVGIIFPATQVASANANCLDDYEEGTWTPSVGGGSGTAYSTQQGWYTKVGNLVTVGFEIELNTKGTITGGAAIAGLPFTSGSAPVRTSGALSLAGNTGSYVSQGLFVDASSTQISIYTKTAASTFTSQPTGTDFYTATTQIIGSVSYHV